MDAETIERDMGRPEPNWFMDIEAIKKEMDLLERNWFAENRAAAAAKARLEEAARRKKEIMGKIEALENKLIE